MVGPKNYPSMIVGYPIDHDFHEEKTNTFPLWVNQKNMRHAGPSSIPYLWGGSWFETEFLALKHESRILGLSSNPVCGLSIMEQV